MIQLTRAIGIIGLLAFNGTSSANDTKVPLPVSTACQPEGQYQRCITELEDGTKSTYWWKYNATKDCTYVYWTHPEQGSPDPMEVCRIGD